MWSLNVDVCYVNINDGSKWIDIQEINKSNLIIQLSSLELQSTVTGVPIDFADSGILVGHYVFNVAKCSFVCVSKWIKIYKLSSCIHVHVYDLLHMILIRIYWWIQWNLCELNLLGTNFCVQNRQVVSLYRFN